MVPFHSAAIAAELLSSSSCILRKQAGAVRTNVYIFIIADGHIIHLLTFPFSYCVEIKNKLAQNLKKPPKNYRLFLDFSFFLIKNFGGMVVPGTGRAESKKA